MINLADKLVEMIQSENILWLAVIAVAAFSTKISKILELFESRKKAQIDRLNDASKCELLDKSFREFLSQEMQTEYFLYVTKIYAEKQYRDKLFEIHKRADGRLSFFHFKRAASFLRYENKILTVKISKFDIVYSILNNVVALFFGLVASIMFLMPGLIKPVIIIQAFTFYGISVFSLATALLFAYQTWPLRSAKHIRKELERDHNNSKQPTVNTAAG